LFAYNITLPIKIQLVNKEQTNVRSSI